MRHVHNYCEFSPAGFLKLALYSRFMVKKPPLAMTGAYVKKGRGRGATMHWPRRVDFKRV
jgi:hypothetical protein